MFIKNNKPHIFFLIIFFTISFFIGSNKVLAGSSAGFSPASGTYHVGDTIRVKVIASTDKPMNAFSANVTFSKETLTLDSISKSSSLIDLWPREAVASNSGGFTNFEGVILNGYTGDAGNMITLVFKAKSTGMATLQFTAVSILANDGEGTEIFSGGLSTATFKIEKAVYVPTVVEKPAPITVCKNENTGEQQSVISCIVINAAEKIKETEISNNLPSHSLLVAIIILLTIIFSLIVIYLFFFINRLKNYFKNKLTRTEDVIDRDFKNLEKDIKSKVFDKKMLKNIKTEAQENDILGEVADTEEKIIKEVDKVREEL
jgi:hypothetical protein